MTGFSLPNDETSTLLLAIHKQAKRLHALLCTNQVVGAHHPWSRPGLQIVWEKEHNKEMVYRVFVHSLNNQRFYFSNSYKPMLSTDVYIGSLEKNVQLELSYSKQEQYGMLSSWINKDAFESAPYALEQACNAIQNNMPMNPEHSWGQSLVWHLQSMPDWKIWREDELGVWLERWGTKEMAQKMKVATAIGAPLQDLAGWKELVLSSWQQTTLPSTLELPTTMQEAIHAF